MYHQWGLGKIWANNAEPYQMPSHVVSCHIWSSPSLFAYSLFLLKMIKIEKYHPTPDKLKMDWPK